MGLRGGQGRVERQRRQPQVRHAVVDGRPVVIDGRPVTVDPRDVLECAQAAWTATAKRMEM